MVDLVDRYRAAVMDCPLRVWRIEHGVSLTMAARMLKVTTTTLTKWEHGGTPNTEHMGRIARLLEVTLMEACDKWAQWESTLPAA